MRNEDEATILPYLKENVNYDFFTEVLALNYPIDIMVPPKAQDEFVDTLKSRSIEYTVVDENVER